MSKVPYVPLADCVSAPLLNVRTGSSLGVLDLEVETAVDVFEAVSLCGVHLRRFFRHFQSVSHKLREFLGAFKALVKIIVSRIVRRHSVVTAYAEAEILPHREEIHYLNILLRTYRIKLSAEPASGQLGTSVVVAVTSLLLDEYDLHTLSLSLLDHIGDRCVILVAVGVIRVVDADRDYVLVAGLSVGLDRLKLSAVHKALGVLSARSHIPDFIALNIASEELSPAVLSGISLIVVICDRGVSAYPDHFRHLTGGVDLLYLDSGDRTLTVLDTRNCLYIELSVCNRQLDRLCRVETCEVHYLEHSLHFNRASGGVSYRDLNLVKSLWQIYVEGVCSVVALELDRVTSCTAASGGYISDIPRLSKAVAP